MIPEIDNKLDQFYQPDSSRFCDYTIWKEVFDIAVSYEVINPAVYFYEIKRLRDLKNTFDYAVKEEYRNGYNEGRKEGRKAADIRIGTAMKTGGEHVEKIMRYTGLTIVEVEKL